MTFNEFCFKLSYFYNNIILKIALFIAPRIGRSKNNNYNKYFKDGHTFENWKRFMDAFKIADESTYNLVMYLPLVCTIITLFAIFVTIIYYIK